MTRLDVQREVVEFEVLHEDASDAPSFVNVNLAAHARRRRQPRRLLRLAENVVDVEQRVPVTAEVNAFELLYI